MCLGVTFEVAKNFFQWVSTLQQRDHSTHIFLFVTLPISVEKEEYRLEHNCGEASCRSDILSENYLTSNSAWNFRLCCLW